MKLPSPAQALVALREAVCSDAGPCRTPGPGELDGARFVALLQGGAWAPMGRIGATAEHARPLELEPHDTDSLLLRIEGLVAQGSQGGGTAASPGSGDAVQIRLLWRLWGLRVQLAATSSVQREVLRWHGGSLQQRLQQRLAREVRVDVMERLAPLESTAMKPQSP